MIYTLLVQTNTKFRLNSIAIWKKISRQSMGNITMLTLLRTMKVLNLN